MSHNWQAAQYCGVFWSDLRCISFVSTPKKCFSEQINNFVTFSYETKQNALNTRKMMKITSFGFSLPKMCVFFCKKGMCCNKTAHKAEIWPNSAKVMPSLGIASCTQVARKLHASFWVARKLHASCTQVARKLHASCTPCERKYQKMINFDKICKKIELVRNFDIFL